MRRQWIAALAFCLPLVLVSPAISRQACTVQLINSQGEAIGQATITQSAEGVLISAHAGGISPGWHAFHIHETGKCEPPGFTSAGGHFNPTGAGHGFLDGDGHHAGDLPNVYVGEDGRLDVDVFTKQVSLAPGGPASLADADGSSLVIHAGRDDYRTDPAGDAGGRIACAVIAPPMTQE